MVPVPVPAPYLDHKKLVLPVIKYIILYLVPVPVPLVKKLRFLLFRFHNAATVAYQGNISHPQESLIDLIDIHAQRQKGS
jgi:hypothetical protein